MAFIELSWGIGALVEYLNVLLTFYLVLIFINILLSWLPRPPTHPAALAVIRFATDLTDPYLNLFRKIIPPLRAGGMGIDLSPIVATILLSFGGRFLISLIAHAA